VGGGVKVVRGVGGGGGVGVVKWVWGGGGSGEGYWFFLHLDCHSQLVG